MSLVASAAAVPRLAPVGGLGLAWLGSEEVAALASAGRGAWGREVDRQAFAERWMAWGRGAGFATFALLVGWSVVQGLATRLRLFADSLPRPSFRPVVVVTLVGLATTFGTTVIVKVLGRRADEARFAELLQRLRSDTDNYWEKQSVLDATC